jgi:hypothetical protein
LFFKNEGFNSGAGQQQAGHHAGRAATGDAALDGNGSLAWSMDRC